MTGSYRFREGRVFVCLWILCQLYIVLEGRRYDKCVTRDGRQGVCVIKRYCREATHQTLAACDGDEENHCCPLPTTQRSAVAFPVPDQRQPDQDRPKQRPHDQDGPKQRPPDRDGPKQRPPDRDGPKQRPHDQDGPKQWPRDQDGPKQRPPDQDGPKQRPPDRDDRLNKTPPPGDRRSPTRHVNDPPKKPLSRDKAEDHGNGRRRPTLQQDNPRDVLPEKQGHYGETGESRPSQRPTPNDPRNYSTRRPSNDRIQPTKGETSTTRKPAPPRGDRPQKNRTDDTIKAPIRFPDTYEFSVPSPKVPACGVKPYELFIAGGQESNKHEWPWMTAIFRRHPDSRPKTFLCGGALINTKYVLSAAHCFVNNYVILPASSFVVRVGSHYLNSGEDYTVANLVLHHNHSGSDFFNDIALVRLASEVYVTDKVAPICLPDPSMMWDNLVGRMATVAGWGDTSFRTGHTRILQHVTIPVVSGEECFAAYSRVRGAAFLARGSDHVICAGLREGGKDACLGDSGGPLMLKMPDDRWVVIGIVSLGYKCAEPGYPGVYTRVTHYMSWINTNMKRH